MILSQRIQSLTASPIRKLSPYADAAKAAGKKVYHLNIGQPDIATPAQFMDSVREFQAPVIAYSNSKGEMFLLKAVQKYYAEKGMDYAIEDIFVTNGGSEALIFAVMALCDPGDEIMVFEPFYANYTTFCKEFGAKINAVPTSVENGYHLPSEEEIEKHITPKTKAILLTNPGNPTGVVYTEAEQDMISRIVRKHNLALIADEVYREFVYDGAYRSFGTMPELDDNLIIIDSVSKRYSECGIRIGALITKNPQVRAAVMKLCQARLSPPLLGQIVAEASLDAPEDYYRDVYEEYVERRKCLIDGLNRIPGVYSPIPMGAFYTVAKLPVDDSEKFCRWCLEEFQYEGETVMMAPAAGFYTTPGAGINQVRIAYVLKKEDLERALIVLRKALEAYPGRVDSND